MGSLDPILGQVERDIERLVMEHAERFDEVFEEYEEELEIRVRGAREKERTLADFVLDRASLRRDKANELLNRSPLARWSDLQTFIDNLLTYAGGTCKDHPDGGQVISLSPRLAGRLRTRKAVVRGTFNPETARDIEQIEFLAFGHGLVDRLVDHAIAAEAATTGSRHVPEDPEGVRVEVIYEIRGEGLRPSGRMLRHLISEDLLVQSVELTSPPPLGSPITVEVPIWTADAIRASRLAFETEHDALRQQVRGEDEQVKAQEVARAERIFRYREVRLRKLIEDQAAWIGEREASGSERDKKVLPARRGQLVKNRERLERLRDDYEAQVDQINSRKASALPDSCRRRCGRRMKPPLAYGIDFGTTNSSISIAYADRVEVVELAAGEMPWSLRSLVYLHRDDNRAVGREGVEQYLVTGSARPRCSSCALVDRFNGGTYSDCGQYRPGGGCHDSRLISGLKSELSQPDFKATHSWATDFSLAGLVAIVLRRLKASADELCGSNVQRLVLGHPVLFAGAEGPEASLRQATALDRLKEAAVLAGFQEVVLLDEPAAAVMDEPLEEGLVLAVDFGGGTFDVALMEFSPGSGEVIGLQGAAVGGELFDRLLFDAKIAPALGLSEPFVSPTGKVFTLPNWFRGLLSTLAGAKYLLGDPNVTSLLREYAGYEGGERLTMIEEILYGGHAFHFYQAIEDAKIRLSTEAATSIEFHRPGVDVSVEVTRREFESLIASSMAVIRKQIESTLDEAGVHADDVDLVLRTGGSSGISCFVRMLEEMFGAAKVHERPAFTTVVHGLGTFARGEWSE